MNKENILIELVITNQCNKRCKYCDLNFSNNFQNKKTLDLFINFLENNYEKVNGFLINFFGGEPLLRFDLIEYFLEKTSKYLKIKYSLGTNWILLDEKKFKILERNKVKIYFSIDTETNWNIFEKKFLKNYENLKVNFILNPKTIDLSFDIFNKLVNFWIKKFNIIPVYISINWGIQELKKLKKFINFTKIFKDINIDFFSYYQKPTSDLQFILDTNLHFYRDIHTHLWFLKQYSSISLEKRKFIEEFSRLWLLDSILSINELIEKYNQSDIFKQSILIPRNLGFEKTLKIIDKIIKW